MDSVNLHKYYESIPFQASDSPKVLDISGDLTTLANDGTTYYGGSVSFINSGDAGLQIEISYDGVNYGDEITVLSREVHKVSSSGVKKIRVTHTGTDTAYQCIAFSNINGDFDMSGGNINASITTRDTAAIDAFGRFRVSNPETIFDSKNIFDDSDIANTEENMPLFFDNQEVSGSGTSTAYNANKSEQSLSVSNLTAGKRIRQTKRRFNYQPGKSLLINMSFIFDEQQSGITQREGAFDDKNGLFFEDNGSEYRVVRRTYTSGSAVDNATSQSDWNVDKMDGTGESGITLDFTKTQILVIDLEWLGVGRVRFGFVVDGKIYYVHRINNTNNLSEVYMSTPNLPLRSEIFNDGTGGAATLVQVCNSVMSEGGQKPTGLIRYASTEGNEVTASTEGTIYAIIGIRLKSNYIGATISILTTSLQVQTASDKIEYLLIYNPTVAGTFTYSDQSLSAVQIAKGATANTVTGGTVIAGGYIESGGAASGSAGSSVSEIDNVLTIGSNIDDTRDEIVLCARPIAGSSSVEVEGSLTWRELS